MRQDDFGKYFKVEGAGDFQIGLSPSAVTGQTAGFHISVSWTRLKYVGGIMSRSEAKLLADHIYKELAECSDTEEECVSKAYTGPK